MAKRKFKLPGVEQIKKDQDRVLRLPEKGQFLVVGGPGTGKSVVSLLRALKFHKNNDYIFLTFNHVLKSASNQVDFNQSKDSDNRIILKSWTLQSWFYKLQYKLTKEWMPELEPHKPNYDEVIKRFEDLKIDSRSLHIIIDEGQDMPPKFYESLMHCGYENFFIVADQNQQITDDCSSRQELADLLGVEQKDIIELTENHRNSHPIALFAQHFFTDPSSPLPELPPKSKSLLGTPILYEYTDYNDCAKLILREADKDDRNLIGVVVANDDKRNNYAKTLESIDIKLDNPKPIISTYSNRNNENVNIDFSNGGIVILNDKSIKGLEFDIVFIIIDGFNIYNNDIDSMKKRFYVMSSRAIKKLVFFKSENYNGGIESILPEDENILKKERLNNG
ncbi:MAG: AAA family ATPase [Arcobacteraceae bacterium]|nr:AAA family ATPase [Arcobacteraceae bacterium]